MPEAPGAPGNRAFAATGAQLDRQSARGHSRRDHAAVLRDARSGRIGPGDSSGAWERRASVFLLRWQRRCRAPGTVSAGPMCGARSRSGSGWSIFRAGFPADQGHCSPRGPEAARRSRRPSIEPGRRTGGAVAPGSQHAETRRLAPGAGQGPIERRVVPGRQGLPRGHEEPPDPDGRQAAKTAAETPEQAVGRIVTAEQVGPGAQDPDGRDCRDGCGALAPAAANRPSSCRAVGDASKINSNVRHIYTGKGNLSRALLRSRFLAARPLPLVARPGALRASDGRIPGRSRFASKVGSS